MITMVRNNNCLTSNSHYEHFYQSTTVHHKVQFLLITALGRLQILLKDKCTQKWNFSQYLLTSSAGRAGWLVIGRSLVQVPAAGSAGLHVEVSLSKILNPTLLTSEGPAMSWWFMRPWDKTGIGSSSNPMETPWFGQWHDMTMLMKCLLNNWSMWGLV